MKKWSFLLLACAATLLFMVGCGEQTASSGASSAASSAAASSAEEAVVYENSQLGIRFELPAVFRDHLKVEENTEEMGGRAGQRALHPL